MKNSNLHPEEIHLIMYSDDNMLFLHTPTLQLYPLNKDNRELSDFLQYYKKNGYDSSISHYGLDRFKELYDFIQNKIDNAPKTVYFKSPERNMEYFTNIVLPISASCNLNCPYCFAQSDGGFKFSDYSEKDIQEIVDFIVKKNDADTPITLIFFGGEPLLRFDIIKFTVNYCRKTYPERKFGYSMTTNGTILNEEVLSFIKENNMSILISLDGPDNEFNLRRFKNGRKSIDKVIKNLEYIRDAGVRLEIRATLVNSNPYICETFDFFENLGIPFNVVFAYASENKSHHYADYNDDNLRHIASQFDELFDFYTKKIWNKEPLYNKMLFENIELIRYRITREVSCSAGVTYFTIMSNGDIFSCAHFMNNHKYCIGNIKDENINKEQYVPVPINQIKECANCWAKQLCLGGCLAQKIYMGGRCDTAQTKEECKLNKIVWTFYIKMYFHIMQNAPGYLIKSTEEKGNIINC